MNFSKVHRSASEGRRYGLAHRASLVIPALLVTGVIAAACGSSTTTSGNTSPGGGGGSSSVAVDAKAMSNLGTILVDSKGFTLYTLNKDSTNHSTCTGSCAQIWPPLLITGGGSPAAGSGVSGLGTIAASGGQQVTYHGMPLYTFSGDTSAGQTNGQNVTDEWGTWLVASTSGGGATTTTAGGGGGGATTTTAGGGGVGF